MSIKQFCFKDSELNLAPNLSILSSLWSLHSLLFVRVNFELFVEQNFKMLIRKYLPENFIGECFA